MDDGERYDTAYCEVSVPLPTPLGCFGIMSGVFVCPTRLLHEAGALILSFLYGVTALSYLLPLAPLVTYHHPLP